jgi:hypothetical protein
MLEWGSVTKRAPPRGKDEGRLSGGGKSKVNQYPMTTYGGSGTEVKLKWNGYWLTFDFLLPATSRPLQVPFRQPYVHLKRDIVR